MNIYVPNSDSLDNDYDISAGEFHIALNPAVNTMSYNSPKNQNSKGKIFEVMYNLHPLD